MKKVVAKKAPPYPFFLEAAGADGLLRKPMFGCFAYYRDEKILFIVRERDSAPADNGIWIISADEAARDSLMTELPSMRPIYMFEKEEGLWKNLPADSDAFEEEAFAFAELVVSGDERVGRVPKAKKKLGAKKRTPPKKAAPKKKPVPKKTAKKKRRG